MNSSLNNSVINLRGDSTLNPLSVILTVILYPSQIGVQTSHLQMTTANAESLMWERYDEEVASLADNSVITTNGLLEQINVTRDTSDYLWYITR